MGGPSANPKFPKNPKIQEIFRLTMWLTNLQVKIQMCDWGEFLDVGRRRKGRCWGIWRYVAECQFLEAAAHSSLEKEGRGPRLRPGVKVVMFGDLGSVLGSIQYTHPNIPSFSAQKTFSSNQSYSLN